MYYPLCMKIFGYGNGWKALQKCHVVTIAHCTFGHSHIWKKWPTRCQQGVNRVSTRCQQGVKFVISARGKKCEVILSVFCLSSENHLRICVCICNLFLEGGTRSKKKIDILEKWRGGEKTKTKCGFNKRSITPFAEHLVFSVSTIAIIATRPNKYRRVDWGSFRCWRSVTSRISSSCFLSIERLQVWQWKIKKENICSCLDPSNIVIWQLKVGVVAPFGRLTLSFRLQRVQNGWLYRCARRMLVL